MNTRWFQDALIRAGATQADLARQLELPPSAVSRMLRGERNMKLSEAIKVAAFLGASQEEVMRQAANEDGPPSEHRPRGRPPSRTLGIPRQSDPIPIRNEQDEPSGFTGRPANLAGVRDAYAIYMGDQSLEPRYKPGWLLHVNPFKPPTVGRDVVVHKTDHTMLIRQFGGWDGDTLLLRRLTPEETQRVPRKEVAACHLIVGVDQEG